jgi:hypothetical protein
MRGGAHSSRSHKVECLVQRRPRAALPPLGLAARPHKKAAPGPALPRTWLALHLPAVQGFPEHTTSGLPLGHLTGRTLCSCWAAERATPSSDALVALRSSRYCVMLLALKAGSDRAAAVWGRGGGGCGVGPGHVGWGGCRGAGSAAARVAAAAVGAGGCEGLTKGRVRVRELHQDHDGGEQEEWARRSHRRWALESPKIGGRTVVWRLHGVNVFEQ